MNIQTIYEGNIGVNKNNPQYPLDISGSVKFTTIRDTNNNIGSSGQVLSSTGNGLSWTDVSGGGGSGSTSIVVSNDTTDTTNFLTFVNNPPNGTSQSLKGNSNLIYDAFNNRVGIGTATPSTTLDVSGTANITGNLSVDTNTLFVDASNNRVGIGTTTPAESLDVSGWIRVGTNTGLKFRTSGASGTPNISVSGDNILSFNNTANITTMALTNNNLVGIGTTAPSRLLEVVGEGTGNPQVRIRSNNADPDKNAGLLFTGITNDISANRYSTLILDANGANGTGSDYLYFESRGSGASLISNQANAPLTFGTATLDRMTILGNGNVGINTPTPNFRLDVNGQVLSRGYVLTGNNEDLATLPSAGLYAMTAESPYLDKAVVLSSRTDAQRPIVFATSSGTIPNERMRIINKPAGNSPAVGIGTTNPQMHLAIQNYGGLDGNSNEFIIRANNYYDNTNLRTESIKAGFSQYLQFSPATGQIAFLNTETSATSADEPITLIERMRITSAGNVGIGNNNPVSKLVIGNSMGSGYGATIDSSGTQFGAVVRTYSSSPSTDNNAVLWCRNINTTTSADTSIFRVNNNGNVGIGTTTPDVALDISSNNNDTQLRLTSNSRSGLLFFNGSKRWQLEAGGANVGSNNIGIVEAGIGTRLTCISGGNVGIGTTTPAEKLNINGGNLLMNGTFDGMLMNPGSGAGSLAITRGGTFTNNVQQINAPYTDNIGSSAGGGAQISLLKDEMTFSTFPTTATAGTPITLTERMRITSTGVGINTTNPVYKLQVEGSGTANEVVAWFNNQGAFSSSIAVRQAAKTAYITNHSGSGTPNYDGQLSNAISFGVSSGASPIQFWNGNTGVGSRGTAKMTILENGNTGIGTSAPTFQLQLSTDSAAKPTSNTWTISSDQRVKTNIENADLDRCNEIVENLSLKRFQWSEKYFPNVSDRNSIGFIAQEVEQYFPNAVKTHKNKFLLQKGETEEENIYEEIEDFKSLDIDQLIKCLFGSVKYLQNQVKTLEERIAKLE